MTPVEFFDTHRQNMQGDVPFGDLPFYKWLNGHESAPGRFVDALFDYYEGHEIKGAFSEEEIRSYRFIHQAFWSAKLKNEKMV